MLTTLANAALPSCMVSSPAMVLLLYPIILIEAAVIRECVKPVPERVRGLSVVMNLWSTFVGVPAAVVMGYFLLEHAAPHTFENASFFGKIAFLLGEGFILGPGDGDRAWMFWAGASLIHAGFCIVSILVEWLALRWMLRGTKSRGIAKAAIVGNLITYMLMPIGYIAIVLIISVLWD